MVEVLVMVFALVVEPAMGKIRPRQCQPHDEGETERRD